MNKTEIIIEKVTDCLPTNLDMERFCKDYTDYQWLQLTSDSKFIDVFTINLELAKEISDKILNKEISNTNNLS